MLTKSIAHNRRGWWAIIVLIGVCFSGSLNRQLVMLSINPIEKDLGLNDSSMGFLFGPSTAILSSLAGFAIGWLTDKTQRHLLLAFCVLIWSIGIFAIGLANSLTLIFVGVMLLAIFEGALMGISSSMIPDLFDEEARPTANMIYMTASSMLTGICMAMSGLLNDFVVKHTNLLPEILKHASAWRITFYIAASLGLPLFLCIISIGKIKRKSIAHDPLATNSSDIKNYFKNHWRSSASLYLSYGFALLAMGSISTWTPTVLTRTFKLSTGTLSSGLGLVILGSSPLGLAISRFLYSKLKLKFGKITSRKIFQFCVLASAGVLCVEYFATSITQMYVLILIQVAFFTAAGDQIITIFQDISPAHLRGRLTSIFLFTSGSLIASFAPYIIGLISDLLSKHSSGLLISIIIVSAPSLVLSFIALRLGDGLFKRNYIMSGASNSESSLITDS
jgi:MFS family permease